MSLRTISAELVQQYNTATERAYLPLAYQTKEINVLKALASSNEAQLLYTEGGLFTDCCTENPIMNVTLNARNTLLSFLPIEQDNFQYTQFGYLTNVTGLSNDRPAEPCADGPTVGELQACFGRCVKGRIKASSETIELDEVIKRLCSGIRTDLFLLGNTRGVSFAPSGGELQEMANNTDLVRAGVMMRQMSLLGKGLQEEIARQLWTGQGRHPVTNVPGPNDTGGWKEFTGLFTLVSDQYGSGNFGETGDNCAALNSDIKTFGGCLGASDVTIYQYLTVLEDTLWQRADMMGYENVESVIVMPSGMWSRIIELWPCQQAAYGCQGADQTINNAAAVVINTDVAGRNLVMNRMEETRTISLNGRTYPVILDSMMPVTEIAAPDPVLGGDSVQYESSIFFIPLRIDGVPVTYIASADYRALSNELGDDVLDNMYSFGGWSDSGRYLHTIEAKGECMKVSTKIEVGLCFLAPYLAGRIDEVCWNRLQPSPFSAASNNPL